MKLKAHVEGLAITVIFAAVLAKDTLTRITADETVNAVNADAVYAWPCREACDGGQRRGRH